MTLLDLATTAAVLGGALALAPPMIDQIHADATTAHVRITGHQADLLGQAYYARRGYHAETCSDLVDSGYISADDATLRNCQIIDYRLRDLSARAALQGVR